MKKLTPEEELCVKEMMETVRRMERERELLRVAKERVAAEKLKGDNL